MEINQIKTYVGTRGIYRYARVRPLKISLTGLAFPGGGRVKPATTVVYGGKTFTPVHSFTVFERALFDIR